VKQKFKSCGSNVRKINCLTTANLGNAQKKCFPVPGGYF
jgi:hypothetical protein